MRDTELYQRVLGLSEPWFVDRVELKVAEKRVDIWIDQPPGHDAYVHAGDAMSYCP